MQSTTIPELQSPVQTASFLDKELEALIARASAISFDFFDTLFIRPLMDPEDAFELVGRRFGIPDFRARRRAAQTEAFRRMGAAARKEITLDEIYGCMAEAKVSTNELMRAEYGLELTLVKPNPEVFPLFLELVRAGKKVVITSDMYLPGDFFADALRPHGLENVPVFISADRNATKRDAGELFDVVAAHLQLEPDTILHIGDNLLADVTRAREKRMMAFHYKNTRAAAVEKTASFMTSVAYGMLCASAHETPLSSYAELGFVYGGAANYGFLEWIRKQAPLDGVDQVLFLSRDGYALQRIAEQQASENLPRSCYFLGSRTTYTLAAMRDENFDAHIPFLLSGAGGLAPCELLERIGVTPPSPGVMNDLGLGGDVKIGPDHYARLASFLVAYRKEILKVCARNRRGLFRYLREMGVKPGSRVAVVDVGWNGTTQEAFEAAVRPLMDLDVIGYYFCLADTPDRAKRGATQKMTAFIDEANTSSKIVEAVYANRVAVEQFFSAPHGSVIGFQPHSTGVQPVMDPGRGDTSALNGIAQDICRGIEAFAKHFETFRRATHLQATPLEIAWPLIELLTEGTHSNAYQMMGRIKNFDAWGSSRNHELTLANYLPSAA
jgi:FMN phosphatase YigB (HAD superfamily)